MEIKINGEKRDVQDRITIESLVTQLGLLSDRLAVEVNREVVRRSEWPNLVLAENDQLEIIHFVGGGTVKSDE